MAQASSKQYKAITGLSWNIGQGEVEVAAGEVASGIPAKSLPWLLEQGLVVEATAEDLAADTETDDKEDK